MLKVVREDDLESSQLDRQNFAFLRLPRAYFDLPYWRISRPYSKAEALLDILKNARYSCKPGYVEINGQVVEYRRGQWVASFRFLSIRWGWSVKKTRGFLNALERDGIVTREVTQGVSILTITDTWTCSHPYHTKGTQTRTLGSTQVTRDGHTSDTKQKKRSKTVRNDDNHHLNEIFDLYNELCPSLKPVVLRDDKQRLEIASRLWNRAMNQANGDEVKAFKFLRRIFGGAESGPFFRGERTKEDNQDWKADFCYIARDEVVTKIVEGDFEKDSDWVSQNSVELGVESIKEPDGDWRYAFKEEYGRIHDDSWNELPHYVQQVLKEKYFSETNHEEVI